MSLTQRKAVIRTLVKEGKYDKIDSKNIEIAIFGMCKSLHEETSDKTTVLYGKFAYEKVGEFITYPNLKNAILEDIANNIINWDSAVYKAWKHNETSIVSEIVEGIKVAKGEFKCRVDWCKSDECFYFQSQNRSCDEPPTTFVVCIKCGGRYKFG